MATLALAPPEMADQQTDPQGQQGQQQAKPQQETREQRLMRLGVDKDTESLLLEVRRRHLRRWSMQYRTIVREILRKIEYLKGNQYYNFDHFAFNWYDPSQDVTEGSEQDNDDTYLHNRVPHWRGR